MPWELGYFDGFSPRKVWILPLVDSSDSEFVSQEYLGLYPAIEDLAGLYSSITLGFDNVSFGNERRQVLLTEAVRGSGIHYS